MNTLLFFLALMSNGLGTAAEPVNADDESRVTSFRDIVWGSAVDSTYVNGEKLSFYPITTKDAKPNSYYLKNDKLKIGNVDLNKIEYFFNEEGRFYKVRLEGPKIDAEQMNFIVEYKFGDPDTESTADGVTTHQWLIKDVMFTLHEFEFHTFELVIESDWEAAEAFMKNTSVQDF